MYHRNEIVSYLQTNKILALKLDHALASLKTQVSNQLNTLGAGATRITYYTSCFTEEYQDVCKKQRTEDIRFTEGVKHLLVNGGVVYDMLKIYFEELFKFKSSKQLEHIQKMLMAVNVHIAASSLTGAGFTLAVAATVSVGMKLSMEMSLLAGRTAGTVVGIVSSYGLVQKAADSAQRLHYTFPAYYAALYANELEMMYFLIEPIFERANAFQAQWASDEEIANIITKMIR